MGSMCNQKHCFHACYTVSACLVPRHLQWKCEESGLQENLWLNLSTGHIGSGRPVRLSAVWAVLATS